MTRPLQFFIAGILLVTSSLHCMSQYQINTTGGVCASYGSNEFAPFYMVSNRGGTLTQSKNLLLNIGVSDSLNPEKRFDFSWGIEAYGGLQSSVDYQRWDRASHRLVADNSQRPATIWIQQLYGELKYRCLYLGIGMKDRGSALLNQDLTSGDVTWSGNARGIPEVRIGFVGFQDIPFTNKWVQIDLALSYGKFFDKKWVENHFSYRNGQICPSPLWTYKRLYLQTNPDKNFNFLFGFQMTGLFGGKSYQYDDGLLIKTIDNYGGIRDFFDMLLPLDSDREGYKVGDHKGSWDGAARYRLRNGDELRAYFEWFWEDGSGLLKNNGWDGLWGLEYKSSKRWWINGAVVEYLDFTHQSGPLTWAEVDHPDSDLHMSVKGHDNYYNSWYYRPYTNYGMTIGTPMVMGTIYNLDGSPAIKASRVRGIHIAVEGCVGSQIDWRLKYNHRKAWGMANSMALAYPMQANSWMLEAKWRPASLKGLSLNCQIALDRGNCPTNAAAVMVGLTYDNIISLGKTK